MKSATAHRLRGILDPIAKDGRQPTAAEVDMVRAAQNEICDREFLAELQTFGPRGTVRERRKMAESLLAHVRFATGAMRKNQLKDFSRPEKVRREFGRLARDS